MTVLHVRSLRDCIKSVVKVGGVLSVSNVLAPAVSGIFIPVELWSSLLETRISHMR